MTKAFLDAIERNSGDDANLFEEYGAEPRARQAWAYSRRPSAGKYDNYDAERDIVDIERGAGRALAYGQIGQSEYNALIDIADDSDKRSYVERLLRYRDHMGGDGIVGNALGRLSDVVAISDTIGGNRFFVSASRASAIAAKDQTGWRPFKNLGIVGDRLPQGGKSWMLNTAWAVGDYIQNLSIGFSTSEFKRAAAERLSYADVLAMGGNQLEGKKGFAVGAAFDIALDPLTWITMGVSSAGKVAIKPSAARAVGLSIGRNADDVARVMTMNKWGQQVMTRAAQNIYDESGEALVKNVIQHYNTGASHIDTLLSASERQLHNQVVDYAIRNYDRIANDLVTDGARAAGWKVTRRLQDAAEVVAGPGAMFNETYNAAMVAKYGRGFGDLVSVHDFSFLRGALGGVVGGRAGESLGYLVGVPGADIAGALGGLVLAGSPKARDVLERVGKLTPGWTWASEKVIGSTHNFVKRTFHSAMKDLPDDFRIQVDNFERESRHMAQATRDSIKDFVQKNGYYKEDFVAVARHLDDPAHYDLDDRLSPLADFARKTLDDVHEREAKFGIGTKYRENYVTHLYATHLNKSLIQWMRDAAFGSGVNKVRVEREFVESSNRFRLAREIATFDDADKAFGEGVVVDDIAEILARRVAMSEKMIAKARFMDAAVERYGIEAYAKMFRSNFNAMNELAQKFGRVSIDFTEVPMGPQHKVSEASIDALANLMGGNKHVADIGRRAKGPFFRGATAAADDAPLAHNRGVLDNFARSAFKRPLSEITQAQFDQMEEFLRGHFIGDVRSKLDFSEAEMQLVEFRVGSNIPRRAGLTNANATRRVAFTAAGIDEAADDAIVGAAQDATQDVMKRMVKLRNTANALRTRIGEERMRWLEDGDPQIVSAGKVAEKRIADAIRRGSANTEKIIAESGPAIRRAELYRSVVEDASLRAKHDRIKRLEAEATKLENMPAEKMLRDAIDPGRRMPLSSGYTEVVKGIEASIRTLSGKIGNVTSKLGKGRLSIVNTISEIARQRQFASVKLTKMDKSFSEFEHKLRDDLAKNPKIAGLHYKDLYDLAELMEKRFVETGDDAYKAAHKQVLDSAAEYTVAHTAHLDAREGIEKLLLDLDGKVKIAAEAVADPKFVEQMDKIEGFAAESKRRKKVIEAIQKEAKEIEARAMLSKDEHGGMYYLPKKIVDALDELHGQHYNNTFVDHLLLAVKKSNNWFKAPMLLFFKDYWFRNFTTNTVNTVTWAGLKLAAPRNVADAALVVGSIVARPGTMFGKRGWLDSARNAMIETAAGRFRAGDIADEIVKRGITSTYTSSESQFLNELHGPLRGIGGLKALFHSARNPRATLARVREAGVVRTGGEALAIASDTMSGLQHPTETLHRAVLFTLAFKETGSFARAAETVGDYLGSFGKLSASEQKYMTNVMPFYSWTRFAVGRALANFDKNPKILATQAKLIQNIQGIVSRGEQGGATDPSMQPWVESSIGITSNGPEGLKKKLMIYGILEDEAMRIAYDAGIFVRNMLHSSAKAIGADSFAYSEMIRPGLSEKDSFKLLANMAFVPRALLELTRGREFFSGAAIGGDALEADENFSRLKNAKHLLEGTIDDTEIPREFTPFLAGDSKALRTADRYGQTVLRLLAQPDANGEGSPMVRWLLGSAVPGSRFVTTLERRLKVRMEYKRAGAESKYAQEVVSTAISALGARAYLYDPQAQRLYLNRSRIDAMRKILIDADAMEFKRINFFTDPDARKR